METLRKWWDKQALNGDVTIIEAKAWELAIRAYKLGKKRQKRIDTVLYERTKIH